MAHSISEKSSSIYDNPENNLQPFFVLHRGCSSSSASSARPKSRRKLNEEAVNEFDDHYLNNLRISAFHSVWSNIESTIKNSFKAVRSCGEPGFAEATQPYPIALDASSKQIFTGLVYTKNMEFVDDQITFEELRNHLKSCGCHVANMSSLDFSAKNGIGGCLSRLLRKFMMMTLDDADMSILASWYCGRSECMPVVIIIEDMERCCASVLSDFILMLSKWVVKIPVILVMGIATTLDAPGNILSSNALLCIRTSKFILGSPFQRMDAIVETVLLRPCSWFNVGHKVALFMRDYFLKHDGTLTSFIRALKIACMQHFSSEPLSFLLKDLGAENDFQEIWKEKHVDMQNMVLKHSSQLCSCGSDKDGEPTSENLVDAIRELKRLQRRWATVVLCLHEAGKPLNVQLLDLYSEALDPDMPKSSTSYDQGTSSRNGCFSSQDGGSFIRASIFKTVHKVRDLPPAALSELLNSWERHADDACEICDKVKELQVLMNSVDSKSSGSDLVNVSLRFSSRGTDAPKDPKVLNEKAVALIEWMLRDQMKPIESLPFHEILCFKKVDKLQTALLGDPRKRIQADLLEVRKYLRCGCCSSRESRLLPSLHDTSILYILAQEHGDIINVHDWFQSFKAILVNPSIKARSKSKHSSTPKKKKNIEHSDSYSAAAIQARFCKGVLELQVTGLLRMPTKRRPDFVQRVAFGL
ncbi:origin of replication complex subunit 3 isoform X1 [Beta vulgaris subsp. vulgaris]|uniref:origin of replication complex subunit 3 isoform X1 n=2 Tax=Beta vulgaris subsp. vulgaris TaxID=3555 RepID=UPI0025467B93|nr:origin of replication complex subunit 3 isoform X1 [Beta vulgaris subsp. vulgaris]